LGVEPVSDSFLELVIEKATTLPAECHVPAIGAATYRRNVTLLRLGRWNETLRR